MKIVRYVEAFLKAVERRYRALHIRQIMGPQPHQASRTETVCLNCETRFSDNYCPRCGQSADTERYHLKNIWQNIAGGFFNIDRGFGKTLIHLLYRPGYMIGDFIHGKRAYYFRPFQMLFVLAAIYIMIAYLVSPEALMQEDKDVPEKENSEMVVLGDMPVGAEETETIVRNIKTNIDNYIQEHKFISNVSKLLKYITQGNKALNIIVMLPIEALALMLVFRRKKKAAYRYNYVEYVFMQTFVECQMLLISILTLPFYGIFSAHPMYELYLTIPFLWLDYKQIFRLGWLNALWRTLLMLLCTFLILIAVAILLALLGILALMLVGLFL